MTEDFTSLALAYLLEELDPAARAQFESRLVADPAAAAELKEIAGTLAGFAQADAPSTPLLAPLKGDMMEQILHARARRTFSAVSLRRFAWPLAAAILLALNIAQWLHSRRVSAQPADPAPLATNDRGFAPANTAAPNAPVLPVSTRRPRALGSAGTPTPPPATSAAPSIRQTVTFSISQTTVTSTTSVASAPRDNPAPQQGALELHNLPRVSDELALYLWARRAGSDSYEPVGEIPRPLYGASGTINYHLRPGTGAAVHFLVTVETRNRVPATPSQDIVCSGP